MPILIFGIVAALSAISIAQAQFRPYDPRCTNNAYGAGSPCNPNINVSDEKGRALGVLATEYRKITTWV